MGGLLNEACRMSKKCYYHPCMKFLTEEYNEDTVIIAFKGTTTTKEVLVDANIDRIDLGQMGKVHRGFYEYFTEKHRYAIDELLKANHNYTNIVFVGHSLGGALATLSACYYGIEQSDKNVYCISFGAPRVGNGKFVKKFREVVFKSFRFVNKGDWVVKVPPSGLYKHVKTKYVVKSDLFEKNPHRLEQYCPCLKKDITGIL